MLNECNSDIFVIVLVYQLGWTSMIRLDNWSWWLEFTPAFYGAGMLSGMNASWSFLGGAVCRSLPLSLPVASILTCVPRSLLGESLGPPQFRLVSPQVSIWARTTVYHTWLFTSMTSSRGPRPPATGCFGLVSLCMSSHLPFLL